MIGADPGLAAVLRQLRSRGGGSVAWYKPSGLRRRIEVRMRARGVDSLAGYARLLARDPAETRRLLSSLQVGVTGFFRDPDSWRRLRDILAAEPAGSGAPFHAWSMGCATGEEAWSLAMLLQSVRRTDGPTDSGLIGPPVRRSAGPPGFQVLGSDVDARALAIAEAGVYPEVDLGSVHDLVDQTCGSTVNGVFTVGSELRARVRFRHEDLTRARAGPERFDLICCRNLLIFLSREGQRRILEQAMDSLRPGGLLMLGRTESPISLEHRVTPVDRTLRIYRKNRR